MRRPGLAGAVLLLAAWGALKQPWEERLASESGMGPALKMPVRDALGREMSLAVLGGFRGLVASWLWLEVADAWEQQQWTRLQTLAEVAVTLQPHFRLYWENGAWHMAWNASIHAAQHDLRLTAAERERVSRAWVEAGRRFLERGLAANPDDAVLWVRLAELHWQRRGDYESAARCYERAAGLPGAPEYAERFVAHALERAGRPEEARAVWERLWERVDDLPPEAPERRRVEPHYRRIRGVGEDCAGQPMQGR